MLQRERLTAVQGTQRPPSATYIGVAHREPLALKLLNKVGFASGSLCMTRHIQFNEE